MDFTDLDIDELQRKQDEANQKKNLITSLGSIADAGDRMPSAYDIHVNKSNVGTGNSAKMYDQAAKSVVDPVEQAKQKMALWKENQANKIAELNASRMQKEQERFDPNSESSQSFRKMIEAKFPEVVKSYGESWANVSANDQENIFKPLQLKEQIEARKEQARILAGQRDEARASREAEKQRQIDEKMQGLKTPFGLANTEDDAKKLKEAYESKKNFDKKIEEMIALREKHGGGALLNREDVARGKQLSKDLLLEYKNMAKLGVLSQSDEAIINKIIPEDPLAYNSIGASIQGQDPILSNLKKFKGDSDADFGTKVSTRTRAGVESAAKSGKIKVSNGKETLEIDAADLADAKKDGYSPVSNTAGAR